MSRPAFPFLALTFVVGASVGAAVSRSADHRRPTSPAPEPVWAESITIRRGCEKAVTLEPHHIFTDGPPHTLKAPGKHPPPDVWSVSYQSGRVIVAYTPVEPVTPSP